MRVPTIYDVVCFTINNISQQECNKRKYRRCWIRNEQRWGVNNDNTNDNTPKQKLSSESLGVLVHDLDVAVELKDGKTKRC